MSKLPTFPIGRFFENYLECSQSFYYNVGFVYVNFVGAVYANEVLTVGHIYLRLVFQLPLRVQVNEMCVLANRI